MKSHSHIAAGVPAPRSPKSPKLRQAAGFSLVEVMAALAIFSFALVSVLGSIPLGLASNGNAQRQTGAVSVLSAVTADLRSMSASGTTSPRYGIEVGAGGAIGSGTSQGNSGGPSGGAGGGAGQALFFGGLSGEKFTREMAADSLYRVSVTTASAPAENERRATWALVRVSWPAAAGADGGSRPMGMVETCISLDCR